MDSLEKGFSYLNQWLIAGAVLDVFLENQRLECEGSRYKASADSWSIVEDLRLDVYHRAKRFWCRRSGEDASYFPYSVDATARLYFKYRKREEDEVRRFRLLIEERLGNGSRLF